ncbi:MAG: Mut7-C RNAse domain-containing protein [Chloroflexi bacterium]|nr:Mut7-C RNAse domain-containing protein [Chloroflexota bacterium]
MRFLADQMLGRLAKWLRILGYDTLYSNAWSDAEIARLARAEDRVLLTRDTRLLARKGLKGLYVSSEDLVEQIGQLAREGYLDSRPPFTRCLRCNVSLEQVDKPQVLGQVPPYVYETQDEFRRCPQCGRLFWRGTHWQKMVEKVNRSAR